MRAEQGSQVCCTFPLLAFKCPIIQDNLEAKIVLSSQQRLCLCSVTLDSVIFMGPFQLRPTTLHGPTISGEMWLACVGMTMVLQRLCLCLRRSMVALGYSVLCC